MKIIGQLSTVLNFPAGYRLFSRMVGGGLPGELIWLST